MTERFEEEKEQGRDDRFTERARRVIAIAEGNARQLKSSAIDAQHLLMGIWEEADGLGAKVLKNLLGQDKYQVFVDTFFVQTPADQTEHDPSAFQGLAKEGKKIIEMAIDEAKKLNHHYIGTEHLLLGILRHGESEAVSVLGQLGVTLETARAETERILEQPRPQAYLRSSPLAERYSFRRDFRVAFLEGFLRMDWQVLVTEGQSDKELKVTDVAQNHIVVEDENGPKDLLLSQITGFRSQKAKP